MNQPQILAENLNKVFPNPKLEVLETELNTKKQDKTH